MNLVATGKANEDLVDFGFSNEVDESCEPYTKMHSWGCATRDGVCANASFSQVKHLNKVQ